MRTDLARLVVLRAASSPTAGTGDRRPGAAATDRRHAAERAVLRRRPARRRPRREPIDRRRPSRRSRRSPCPTSRSRPAGEALGSARGAGTHAATRCACSWPARGRSRHRRFADLPDDLSTGRPAGRQHLRHAAGGARRRPSRRHPGRRARERRRLAERVAGRGPAARRDRPRSAATARAIASVLPEGVGLSSGAGYPDAAAPAPASATSRGCPGPPNRSLPHAGRSPDRLLLPPPAVSAGRLTRRSTAGTRAARRWPAPAGRSPPSCWWS